MADAALDVSATLAEDQNRLAIFVVNTSLKPYKRTIDLTAFSPLAAEAECWTLADSAKAGERDAFNSWREPNRVRPQLSQASVTDGSFVLRVPPLSLTVLEIRRGKGNSAFSRQHVQSPTRQLARESGPTCRRPLNTRRLAFPRGKGTTKR